MQLASGIGAVMHYRVGAVITKLQNWRYNAVTGVVGEARKAMVSSVSVSFLK